MSHAMENTDYTKLVDWTIFAIIHPKKEAFYIGKTAGKSLRSCYTGHVRLRYTATIPMFKGISPGVELPHMYILEEINDTKVNAFSHQIVWTKYFMDHNYLSVDPCGIVEYAMDLSEENQIRYDKISAIPINTLCNTEKWLFRDYGKCRMPNNPDADKKQINLYLNKDEYNIICRNASEIGTIKTAYCKQQALDKCVININYKQIENHTNEISRIRTTINDLVHGIARSGQCYEAEVKMILQLFSEICAGEKQLLRQHLYNQKTLKKLIRNMSNKITPISGNYEM